MIMSERPCKRTPKMLEEIMDEIMSGKSLKAISKLKRMPSLTTMYRWMRDDEEFRKGYSNAVCVWSHAMILDALEIVDRPKASTTEVAADKLRYEARLKVAGMLNPKHYGDRSVQDEPDKEDKLDKVIVEIVRSGEDVYSDKGE
jgi:hypothetical protein